jgi:hypothetical protein
MQYKYTASVSWAPQVGASHYVREYVRNKCGTICKDVKTMRVCAALTMSPTPTTSTSLHTPTSLISNIRLLDYS